MPTTVSRIKLHPQGPEFSRLVYGTWRLGDQPEFNNPQSVLERIEACLSVGITTFDLADIYGGFTYEKLFGQALALKPELRKKMEIVTKCGILYPCDHNKPMGVYVKHYNTSKEYIISQLERSLKEVGTSYIDLLLIHRPDPLMDADEIGEAFNILKSSGKVKHFGVSNFTTSQFDLIQSRLSFPLVTNQIEVSLFYKQPMHDGTLDQLQRLRVSPMAWSPIGGGRLFTETPDAQTNRLVSALTKVGSSFGSNVSIDQICFAWLLAHPSKMLPVIGTNKVERILKLAECEKYKLDKQQWYTIWEASEGKECP
ncbi:hypothetical protein HDV05_001922 [Chytridiales sp. JEL 0842]|nr:hypothetical protein HDV05_001922 [Chytridiales sp. JEL 0842]